MVGFVLYAVAGIVLFAAWPNMPVAAKVSYAIFFPIHCALLCFGRACLMHEGTLEHNPVWNVLVPIGMLWLIWLLCSS